MTFQETLGITSWCVLGLDDIFSEDRAYGGGAASDRNGVGSPAIGIRQRYTGIKRDSVLRMEVKAISSYILLSQNMSETSPLNGACIYPYR